MLKIFNQLQQTLPADPNTENRPRQVQGACYSLVQPTAVAAPRLLTYSAPLATQLGLDQEVCRSADFAQVFAGNRLWPGMQPYALCYGGHQFGHWAGQLGDGRAINLGECRDVAGQLQVLQLKGAGPTPYSRRADGRAVLRSSLREFMCSEAMFHLGIPGTRALSLLLTGEQVLRDMFYDGRPEYEPGAVVCRVAPSFMRFGSLEWLASQKDQTNLIRLLGFILQQHWPSVFEQYQKAPQAALLAWLRQVSQATCDMVVHWMRVGFVHGVMNTDNMSILGLTIDYGPYGWLDNFDPEWTPNTSDRQQARYRFGNQPSVAQWNLWQLANALYPLVPQAEALEAIVHEFAENYQHAWGQMMATKLGLHGDGKDHHDLYQQLNTLMAATETDMTGFFRQLGEDDTLLQGDAEALQDCCYQSLSAADLRRWQQWLDSYRQRIAQSPLSPAARYAQMRAANPQFVPRNYITQMVLDQLEQGDDQLLQTLIAAIASPYQPCEAHQAFPAMRPEWAKQRPGCSSLSCSS